VIDELSGHRGLPSLKISEEFGADVTMPHAKGKRSSPQDQGIDHKQLRHVAVPFPLAGEG
jgi:hypothetical protein